MEVLLDDIEIRVLGSLMEKEMATPEYYPLSLNALLNACNQKSNRDPVVAYDETIVARAIHRLKDKRLVWRSDAARVSKYEENFVKNNDLGRDEAAVMCLLLLRGPQTMGELRSRSERLHKFNDLDEVAQTLEDLSQMGFVKKLPRQPGRKESRFSHLLAGEPEIIEEPSVAQLEPAMQAVEAENKRIASLEEQVETLKQELEMLKNEFQQFRKEFE